MLYVLFYPFGSWDSADLVNTWLRLRLGLDLGRPVRKLQKLNRKVANQFSGFIRN